MLKRPTRLSAQVFSELPPVLSHYLETARATWIETTPNLGRVNFMGRPGLFSDFEAEAVERRQILQILGPSRGRAMYYRMGFELGRRDALRHLDAYEGNVRLALQASPVFLQMQGRFMSHPVRFEFDLESGMLYREIKLTHCAEAAVHRLVQPDPHEPVCWTTCGYLAGHTSEILGRRVIALEKECTAYGGEVCRVIARFDSECGEDANWVRQAFRLEPVEVEIARKEEQATACQEAAERATATLNSLNRRLKTDLLLDSLVAESEDMQPVMRRARQVSKSDVPVLLVGEPGTGRMTLAKAIHLAGTRKAGPFESVDCRGLSGAMLIQELVGFEAGGITGATRPHTGALARAHRGTIYLDEIAGLGGEAQGLLFRALEERMVTPLGAVESVHADVRIIAATQYEPESLLAQGKLREELYYAISVGCIGIPPLRDRVEDVLNLAHKFMVEARERYDRPATQLSKEFKQALIDCAWPGNIRQLRNVIEHAVVFGPNRELGIEDLPEEVISFRAVRPSQELTPEVLRAMLKRTRGNRSEAAELLGIGRTTLWRLMKRYEID